MLSQGHSHFEVKVILESNGNVFRFLPQSRWLALIRMLIFLVIKAEIRLFKEFYSSPRAQLDFFVNSYLTDYTNKQTNQCSVKFTLYECSSNSRGTPDGCPLPSPNRIQFVCFCICFCQKVSMLDVSAPPHGVGNAPNGKSWISPCNCSK